MPGSGRNGGKRVIVLMYHRVQDLALDPWGLCVSPENFRSHLEVLRSDYDIVPADSWNGRATDGSVAITFDDGYADNLYNAKPILERFSAPATVFVSAGYVGGGREYWWDELERLVLLPRALPEVLDLEACGVPARYELGEAARYSPEQANEHVRWRVSSGTRSSPTARHALFLGLRELLMPLPEARKEEILSYLNEWATAAREVRDSHRPMDANELVRLADGDGVVVGSHGVTHRPLPSLDREAKFRELSDSKARLEAILNRRVNRLAYPHSAYDAETLRLAKKAGYALAFGGRKRRFRLRAGRYQIPRVPVGNWDAEEFARRLQSVSA